MTLDIKNLKTAKRYALALFEASKDNLDKVLSDLEIIDNIIIKNNDFMVFFSHPVISLTDKKETIEAALKDKIEKTTINFLEILLDENRFSIFSTIQELFKKEVNKAKNKQLVRVISAVELENNEKENLKEKLSNKLQKEVILNYEIKEEILAGLIIKFEDKVLDLSLRTKFTALKNN